VDLFKRAGYEVRPAYSARALRQPLACLTPFRRLLLARAEPPQVECYAKALPEDLLIQKIADVHAIGIRSKTQLTANVLQAAKKLLTVGCFCIGTNQVALQYAQNRGVPVFNSPFSNSRSVGALRVSPPCTRRCRSHAPQRDAACISVL